MLRYLYIGLCVLLAVAGLTMAGVRWMQRYAETPPIDPRDSEVTNTGQPVVDLENLPQLYPVGEFRFTDQHNQTFNQENVAGKVWVGYLFFTACPGQCPIMTTSMRALSENFLDEEGVCFAGFSVDPDTDTPERLTQYARQYKASNPRWYMLTGPVEDVERLAVSGFRLGSVDDPQMHSEKFVLVDGEGMIRNYYDGTDETEMETLKRDIQRLLDEQRTEGGSAS